MFNVKMHHKKYIKYKILLIKKITKLKILHLIKKYRLNHCYNEVSKRILYNKYKKEKRFLLDAMKRSISNIIYDKCDEVIRKIIHDFEEYIQKEECSMMKKKYHDHHDHSRLPPCHDKEYHQHFYVHRRKYLDELENHINENLYD